MSTNKWTIPYSSLLWIQRIGFGNEQLLERIMVDASMISKRFTKKAKKAYRGTIASVCLLPLPVLSLPFLISAIYRQESLHKHLIDFQRTLNQYLTTEQALVTIKEIMGVEMITALDSAKELTSTDFPSCSIYMDIPKRSIGLNNLMHQINEVASEGQGTDEKGIDSDDSGSDSEDDN